MDNLDKLTEATEIKFTKPVTSDHFFGFCKYLSQHTNYEAELRCVAGARFARDSTGERRFYEISGAIRDRDNMFLSSSFRLREGDTADPEETETFFSYLVFQTTPGYSLEEHNPKDVKIWADIKEAVKAYESANPPEHF